MSNAPVGSSADLTDLRRAPARRLRALRAPLLDGLLAAGLTALILAGAVHEQPGFRSGGLLGLAPAVLLAGPLAWRRTHPQAVLFVTVASFAAASLLGLGAASRVGPVGSLVRCTPWRCTPRLAARWSASGSPRSCYATR